MQISSSPFSPGLLSGRTSSVGGSSFAGTVFSSIDQASQVIVQAGQKYAESYAAKIAADGNEKLSVDQMVAQLKKEFPGYTLVSSEPSDVVKGKNLLYIDDNNLQKMASDPSYRAKVMGLMRRELESQSLQFRSGDSTVHLQVTGSIFSLSDKNPSVDGIPYSGSATSESFTTTTSSSGSGTGGATSRTSARDSLRDWLEKALDRARETRRAEEAKSAQTTKNPHGLVDVVV